MAEITAEMVKQLRQKTGVGMSKCKQALNDAGGDMEKAIELLRKAGMASAVKKSDRATNEGIVTFKEVESAYGIIEANAETDFVVKNEKFIEFVDMLASSVASQKHDSVEAFLSAASDIDSSRSHDDLRVELIQAIGENIQISRVLNLPKRKGHSYGLYKHLNGKIVTAVEIEGSDKADALAKDIAMHIAAEDPDYISPDEIPEAVIAKEREIAKEQLKGKPENMIDKILDGKMKAFGEQVCLLKQKFVKDPSVSVENHVAAISKELGGDLKITHFLRWQLGGA